MSTDAICTRCGQSGHRASTCPWPTQAGVMPALTPTTTARARLGSDGRMRRGDGVRALDDLKARCVIDDETECWLWRGAMSCSNTRKVKPIPRVWIPADASHIPGAGAVFTAAKAAWLLAGKPLAAGHIVWRHVCANSECINPEHGKASERSVMHKAQASSGRLKGDPMRRAVNDKNRSKMLTPADVVLRGEAMFNAGLMSKEVRAALGLSTRTVQLIRHRQHPHSSGRQRVVRGASVFNLGA